MINMQFWVEQNEVLKLDTYQKKSSTILLQFMGICLVIYQQYSVPLRSDSNPFFFC